MPKLRKRVLCYEFFRRVGHRYGQLYLRFFYAEERSMQLQAAGTIGNRAGYGTDEMAKKMGRWYLGLLEQGHQIELQSLRYDAPAPAITIRWQEYDPDDPSHCPSYCDPDVEQIGDGQFTAIQNGAKFLRKVGRRIAKRNDRDDLGNWVLKDPTQVIDALKSMGARHTKVIQGTGEQAYNTARVYDLQPRPWLRTDTLWRSFELR